METLKMRFKLLNLEFEIEGREVAAKEGFEDFKRFVKDELLPQMNNFNPPPEKLPAGVKHISQPLDLLPSGTGNQFPILKEVVKKDLPQSEPDWIIIYAFYAAKFGEKTFTEQEIKDLYNETGRNTADRSAHFKQNFKRAFDKGLFKMHNDSEYLFKEGGIQYVTQILEGKSVARSNNISAKSKASRNDSAEKLNQKKPGKSSTLISIDKNLNLRPEGKKSFKEFADEKRPATAMDFNVAAVYYLTSILELNGITPGKIYTCYKEVNRRPPTNLMQSIRDTAHLKGTIDSSLSDDIKLTIRGENFVEYDLPVKNDK